MRGSLVLGVVFDYPGRFGCLRYAETVKGQASTHGLPAQFVALCVPVNIVPNSISVVGPRGDH
jgi:hypothetical protein